MRSITGVLLTLQGLCHCTNGFSPPHRTSKLSRSALCAANELHKGASAAVAVALGWVMASTPSLAVPLDEMPTATVTSTSSSSTFVVALSDSDFADFSLPSYQDVAAAEINTNLKGGKMLFSEEATATAR